MEQNYKGILKENVLYLSFAGIMPLGLKLVEIERKLIKETNAHFCHYVILLGVMGKSKESEENKYYCKCFIVKYFHHYWYADDIDIAYKIFDEVLKQTIVEN